MNAAQPAINATIDFDPIGLPGEGFLSLTRQDKQLISKGCIVGIICGQ